MATGNRLWHNVIRKVKGGTEVFIHLHIDQKLKKFEFRDNGNIVTWQVSEKQLEEAVAAKKEYVSIRCGAESLRVKRQQLLTAFNNLRGLRKQ